MSDYYVSPNGSDGSGNGTLDQPWKTIARGLTALKTGDTLYLRGGIYVESVYFNTTNGTLKNYNKELVIIDGQKRLPTAEISTAAMVSVVSSGATIEGINIRNSQGRGINVRGNGCTVKSCTVNWAQKNGFYVENCSECIVEYCRVTDANQERRGGSLVFRDVKNCIGRYNVVGNSLAEGLNATRCTNVTLIGNTVFNSALSQLYVESVDTSLVEGNLVFYTNDSSRAGDGIKISNEIYTDINIVTRNVTVINNVAVNNFLNFNISMGTDTVEGPGGDGGSVFVPYAGIKNLKVANNTFINAAEACVRFRDHPQTDPSQHTPSWFINNIMIQDDNKLIFEYSAEKTVAKVTLANNLYSKSPGAFITGKESNEVITKTPGLVNYRKPIYTESDFDVNNYRILSESPAKDAGTSSYVDVAKDLFGTVRPAGPATDIGMHEFQKETIRADFSAQPTNGTSPLSVTFKDLSTPQSAISSRFWDFGDGAVSTEKDPIHEYRQGLYTVSLRVAGESSNDIITKSNLIGVDAPITKPRDRVTEGLSALYDFDEGAGDTIFDVSGVGTPLDLKISDSSAVKWLSQGLQITKPVVAVSNGPASKFNDTCRQTNEFTMEVWLKPKNTDQDGPARIVSVSKNAHSRNLTLGQGLWGTQPSALFDLRLRTTERSANGMPSFSSPVGTASTKKSHVVITRQVSGRTRIIVDKVIVAETFIPGDFSTWNPRFPLLLANETTGDHPWLGDIYLVALYERALTIKEVRQNFAAGTELAPGTATQVTISLNSFKRFVLVSNGTSSALKTGTKTAVAYGVQYPDLRCVLCANGQTNSMAVYSSINAITRAYSKQGLKVQWLD